MIYILDLETNGLSMGDIEITQCSYLKLDNQLNIAEEFNEYYYVSNLKNSEKITNLDHATLAKLSKGNKMKKEDLEKLLSEIRHGVIIGQNINYDILVLDSMCINLDIPITPKYPLDTINQFSPEDTYMNLEWVAKNHMTEEGRKLLKDRFKNKENYHNALYDIYVVYALIKYNSEFKKRLKNYLKYVPRGD